MDNYVVIADSTEPGFSPVWVCNGWRLAVINDSPAFRKENIAVMSRHLLTDETFTLLEVGTTAVVKMGVWHAVETVSGAKILVAENSDTSTANSEKYKLLGDQLPEHP